jgi:hypothetical protein
MDKKKELSDFIGARVDPKLKKSFEDAAGKDSRSISSALVVAIKDYIAKIKEKKT